MKIFWTDVAAKHLAAIHTYIATSSPVYAAQLVRRIQLRTDQLEHFPESGRPTPEGVDHGVREVFERPYRIMYRIKNAQVEIVAVIHMRQLAPDPGPGV